MNEDLIRVLQKAIDDYNIWACKEHYKPEPVHVYAEYRGVLYNKFISALNLYSTHLNLSADMRESINSRKRLMRYLVPSDMVCTFDEGGVLLGLKMFEEPKSMWSNGPIQACIASRIIEALPHIVYVNSPKSFEHTLENIVNQVKIRK